MKKNPITKTLALALASAIPLLPAAAMAEENANAVLVLKLSSLATAAYFVRLIFGDVRDSLSAVDLPGGTKITNLKYTRQLTVEVQDLAGRMIFSKNIEGVASARYSNAVQTNNKSEELLSKVTLDCLKKAADAIDERFVCEVTFKISGPKKDEDFDPDAVELTMDGVGIAAGTPMRMRKGIHEVVANLENYAQVGTKRMSFNADGVRKVVMKSTLCAVTLKVKGPAGDADFDPANATVQLIDAEENANDLSVDDETIVPQSKFRLVATMDGYTAREMRVNLSSAKKSITVTFVKKDFYTPKMPINAVFTALSKVSWCLVGV